jgi:hypothetical protein
MRYSFSLLAHGRRKIAQLFTFSNTLCTKTTSMQGAMETQERGVQDLEAHAAAAWQIFRSMGSPKYHVAVRVL